LYNSENVCFDTGPKPGFKVCEGQNTFLGEQDFYFNYKFKTNFSTTQFGDHTKNVGALAPNAPCGYGPASTLK